MARTITVEGDEFSLVGKAPSLGEHVPVPGKGLRALYIAPSLECWPVDAAKDFAAAAHQFGCAVSFSVCSADDTPIIESWAARTEWQAIRFDEMTIMSLGLWIATLLLPARAVVIVDAENRLRGHVIAARLEDEVPFEKALSILKTLA